MAKRKPTKKTPPKKKSTAKPAAKPKAGRKPAPVAVEDASAALVQFGFFRGEYDWEADRELPCLEARVRLLVDHTGGVVSPEQVRALELLLETETPLRPLALRAAYEYMLGWVENYRKRHPDFRGKPIGEKAFNRACEISEVRFRSPNRSEEKPPPSFHADVYWRDGDGHPWAVFFQWQRGAWVVAACERT
jgi:hypothetical protein